MHIQFDKYDVACAVDSLEPGVYIWTPWFSFGVSKYKQESFYPYSLHNFGFALILSLKHLFIIPSNFYFIEDGFFIWCLKEKKKTSLQNWQNFYRFYPTLKNNPKKYFEALMGSPGVPPRRVLGDERQVNRQVNQAASNRLIDNYFL